MSLKKRLYKIKGYLISLNLVWYLWVFVHKYFSSTLRFYCNNPFQTPIIINNFNRLSTLKLMVLQLKKMGYKNIYVIDNGSQYSPLWEYYNQSNDFVLIVNENLGHRSIFLSKDKRLKKIRKSCFVYTDSDLILNEHLPNNFMEIMFSTLLKNNKVLKVGFAIKIDDVDIENSIKKDKVEWESKYWKNPIEDEKYLASIDTTFALYRPILYKAKNSIVRFYRGIRIAGNFTCRHEPWYWDFDNLNEEQNFYIERATNSSSYVSIMKSKS